MESLNRLRDGDVRILISKNYSTDIGDVTDDSGAGCVHYAARSGRPEVLKRLLSATSSDTFLRHTKFGATALHDAAVVGMKHYLTLNSVFVHVSAYNTQL